MLCVLSSHALSQYDETIDTAEFWQLSASSAGAVVSTTLKDAEFVLSNPSSHSSPLLLVVGPYSPAPHVIVTTEPNGETLQVDLKRLGPGNAKISNLLLNASDATLLASDPERAARLYLKVAEIEEADIGLRKYAAIRAGFAANLGRNPKLADTAIKAFDSLGMCLAECNEYWQLKGDTLFQHDEFESSIVHFRLALEGYSNLPTSRPRELDKAQVAVKLGFAKVLMSQVDEGGRLMEEAVAIAREYGDELFKGRILAIYAGFHAYNKDFLTAESILDEAASLLSGSPDQWSLAEVLVNRATTRRLLGKYRQAIRDGHSALETIATLGDPPTLIGPTYDVLAQVYRTLGDLHRSRHFTQLSIGFESDAGRQWRTVSLKSSLATIERELGNASAALETHLSANRFFKDRGEVNRSVHVEHQLGKDYLALNDLEAAERHLESAWKARKIASGFASLDPLAVDRAKVMRQKGEAAKARDFLLDIYQSRLDESSTTGQIEIGLELLRNLRQLGELQNATDLGIQLIELIEDIRTDLEVRRLGPSWSDRTHQVYEEYALVQLDRHDLQGDVSSLDTAYAAVMRGRGIALRREIEGLGSTGQTANTEGKEDLLAKITILANRRASPALAPEAKQKLTRDYFALVEDLRKLDSKDAGRSKLDLNTKYNPGSAELALTFFCPESEPHCWRFSESEAFVQVRKLEIKELDTAAQAFSTAIKNRRFYKKLADELSTGLLSGLKLQNYDRLTINADHPVSQIPIAALQNPTTDVPLIQSHQIRLAPTLHQLEGRSTQNSPTRRLDFAVFADPNFAVETSTIDPTGALSAWSQQLSRLPWTAKEAAALAELYDRESIRIFEGDLATRTNFFKAEALNARMIHIASHAYVDPVNPSFIGIAMTPERGHPGSGFLTLDELSTQQIHADLVVISGCETGLGSFVRGEGEMSLARGFHARGARSVVSTKWPVSDRATALFMKHFHHALHADPDDIPEALRYAQEKVANTPRFSQPYYWAGYQLSTLL